MPRQDIGDFSGQYPTADLVDARNIRGNVIFAEVIELAGQGGVIRTQDFVSGSEGWAIFADGSAEFQDAILRGTITATGGQITGDLNVSGDIILDSGGAFKTASSGKRLEITQAGVGDITWYDTDGSTEGTIGVYSTGGLRIAAGTEGINIEASDVSVLATAGGFNVTGSISMSSGTMDLGGNNLLNVGRGYFTPGSVSAPGITFGGDTDTGLYKAASNDMRLVAGGSSIAQVTTSTFGPGTDNAYSLGSSGQRWTAVWAVNGTIQTSDMRYKTVLDGPLPGLDFINKLKPFRYIWKGGKDEQAHWGLSAQQVGSLIGDEGPFRDGDILGLSYAEFVPSLILAIQELSAKLEHYETRS